MTRIHRHIFAAIFLSLLLVARTLGAGASTATVILEPDVNSTAPAPAGALYVQSGTLGVSVTTPSGSTLTWAASDIAGGGSVHITQNGIASSYGGAPTNIPVQAMQLQAGPLSLSSATQIPAPDFTFGTGARTTSYTRISALADPLDWNGGIATPAMNGGGQPFGTMMVLLNTSGSGATINIMDQSVTGSMKVGYPSIALGYQEYATFMYDNLGWIFYSRGGAYSFNGGNSGGGRVVKTTDATVTAIMQYAKGGVTTAGIGFTCDVAAQLLNGTGTTSATWQGVKCVWDGASNATLPITIAATSGTNATAPPAGWSLSCTTDASFDRLNVIGVAATSIKWHATNCFSIAPAF